MSEMETVTIPKATYDRLLRDSVFLSCLEAAGVDNWQGYDYAIEMREESENEEGVNNGNAKN